MPNDPPASSLQSGHPPLAIRSLRKRFGRTEVLNRIDLTVPPASVYGFVGLNGAGKTTTIECSLDLLSRNGGDVRLFGRGPRYLTESSGRVGVAFDHPCLHPHFTVREELKHATLLGRRGPHTPEVVMQLLGLERHAKRKTRKLSLGNRRRLSIALSLLGKPELVVLDEPFSGLDPGGVDVLLDLIARLQRDEGMTFFISSHQLHYVERISTHVGIIHEGTMICETPLEALLAEEQRRLRIRVDDRERAVKLLRERPDLRLDESPGDDAEIDLVLAEACPGEINRTLVEAGLMVSELTPRRPTLESVFRRLAGIR